MTPAERLKVLLFLALFFGATGFLFTLLSCGTEYWLLAAETCSRTEDSHGGQREKSGAEAINQMRIFHEGLFWRCSFTVVSYDFTMWDLWIYQPSSKVCHAAFLFPFPVYERMPSRMEPHGLPTEPYEHHSAIVFRTFWSIFLVAGLAALIIGGFVVTCAGSQTNHRLFKVEGALLLFGGLSLLAVVLMYLMWVQVLDTLEQFALHHSVSTCPSFHLRVQHGPSFLLAPVAVFFCLLSGVLFILMGRSVQGMQRNERDKTTELPAADIYL
ncbi:transmembrane protein 182-like isoform X2 [Plectropomus leopardus]|uniref:transmembrane protein 182-like isoform X2 n=1 Tax=Plectropomus leopardus TaxID=160734 RepID=UPI001C4D4AB6|nr:transmembrane protein 182-like isoform X2 [Plectropomus leopardus]